MDKEPLPSTILWCVVLLMLMPALTETVNANITDDLHVRGYVRGMPIRISADVGQSSGQDHNGLLQMPAGDQVWWEYRLQNRLNLRWDAGSDLSFYWQMRTRLFAGDLVRDFPRYASGIDRDEGMVNLSWMVTEQDSWLLHYIPDRLYGEWDRGNWNVRVGRQRVNWGVNMITNPNDIFNIYSFYDFDYPERPGSDAVRIRRFLGFGSRFELAVSPGRELQSTVAAALYAFTVRGYDLQLITGYYKERLTAGGGWAGNMGGAGFKGETMFYMDLEQNGEKRETNYIASVSVDYMFTNRVFLITELLYNRAGGRDRFPFFGEQISPDNPSFSKYQFTTQGTYPVHELVDGSLALIWYPDESSFFLSPSITWSVMQNIDMQLLGQFFIGSDDSAFARAGDLLMGSLQYNF